MIAQEILAQAVCDPGAFEVADRIRDQPFIVHCNGHLTGGDKLPDRDYEIAAPTEREAALAGLDRYVNEMAKLN